MAGASRSWPGLLPVPVSLAEVVLQTSCVSCGVLGALTACQPDIQMLSLDMTNLGTPILF